MSALVSFFFFFSLSTFILSREILFSLSLFVCLQVVLPATYIVIGPLQLMVVCYLLWDWLELGPMAMAGIAVLLLLFPLQVFMGKLSHVLR